MSGSQTATQRRYLSKRQLLEWLNKQKVLLIVTILSLGVFPEVESGDVNCPVSGSKTLFPYPSDGQPQDAYDFHYTFDPFIKTNIDLIDRFFTSDDDVICTWELKAKQNHFITISFEVFDLSKESGYKDGDTLKIYDGDDDDDDMFPVLRGGSTPMDHYTSTGRFMYLVFKQGERTGRRHFRFTYKAIPRSKDTILRIAGIISGSVAAVAIVFLAFKFTRCCRPCRRRCCPDRPPEPQAQRELQSLSAVLVEQPRVQPDPPNAASSSRPAQQPPQPNQLAADEIGYLPNEMPPSYESIFGDSDVEGNKAS